MTSLVATWANEQPFLPRYEILDRIDEGTIAHVFKVRAVRDGSIHALKALKPEHAASETAVARFEDEYRILSSLHFPCLPEVSDYGVASDGTRYMVMEVVNGEALDHYVASHPDDLWILIFELVETLAFIHEHKLLHLDLKPGNILVKRGRFGDDEAPVVVLIDFGLSYRRDVGGEAKLIGTADYMAPEIIRGDESPTRAADYYSLGCVLFELIEGRPPFSGTAYEKFQAHLKEPIRFEQKKVEYSELHPWIEKLTAKDPNDRLDTFQTFRETVAVRLAERVEPLNRAFALGYIDSLGVIGKSDLRRQVLEWVRSVEAGIRSRRFAGSAIGTGRSGGDKKERDAAKPSDVDIDPAEDIGERITRELMSAAVEKEEPDSVHVNRTMILSGPPGSGTPHLIRSIGDELRLSGIHVATLGAGGDWAELASGGSADARRPREVAVDPGSVVVDRFARAWDRLRERSLKGALALLVEDFHRLSREEQEFMGYAIRRTALALSEREEPGVFVVMGADASELQNVLDGAFEEATVLPVPPPGEEEVESIVRSFRGHLAGVDAVRVLTTTLEKNLHGAGAMVMTLRRAVADRDLTFEHGTWNLRQPATPSTPDETGASYYKHVFGDLSESGQRLVEWLCSHPVSLTVDEITGISELEGDVVKEGLEATLPFRIITVNKGGEAETLHITNNDIRKHFYELVDPSKRKGIHGRFIAELSRRPLESWESLRTLAFHYERIGSVRDALTMRMRAVAAARETTDIFAVRDLCETSIEYLDTIADPEWKTRRALLSRHFIKSWINTEWSVGNFGGLAKILKRYFPAHEDVPLSFAYKYATSLERAGQVDDAIAVIEDGKRRSGGKLSETYHNILVQEATLRHGTGAHEVALALLRGVDEERLAKSVRPRYLLAHMISHHALGNKAESDRFFEPTMKACEMVGDNDTMMRARYFSILDLINEAAYKEAKERLRTSIRFATTHRVYRSLHFMYFLAYVLCYAEGSYHRALSYLKKSIRIATDIGFTELRGILDRFAMTYTIMGAYGDAIDSARTAIARIPHTRVWLENRFFTLVVLSYALVLANSRDIHDYLDELSELLPDVNTKSRLGYFHEMCGAYNENIGKYDVAVEEYTKASKYCSEANHPDDDARMRIARGRVFLLAGDVESAKKDIGSLRADVDELESHDIRTTYEALKLQCAVMEQNFEDIRAQTETCESLRGRAAEAMVCMTVDSVLFSALAKLGETDRATAVFRRYYDRGKQICANLGTPERIEDFTQKREFVQLVECFRTLQKENPGQEGD